MVNQAEQIQLLLSKIGNKKLDLEKLKLVFQAEWKTNKQYFTIKGVFTLNDVEKLYIDRIFEDKLIELYADLLLQHDYLQRSKQALGLEFNDDKIQGFTLSEWKHDINKRLAYIKYQSEYKKLEELEKQVESMDSEENKIKRKLLEIEQSL